MKWCLFYSETGGRTKWSTRAAVFLILAAIWASSSVVHAQPSHPPPYRFGVLPLQSPNKLASMFLPLAKVLEARLHRPVRFVTAPSFSIFMQRVAQREYDIVYLNPMLCAEAQKSGYHVVAKIAGEPFTGILVARRDSKITELAAHRLRPGLRLDFPEAEHIRRTLAEQDGNQVTAARVLGISRSTLHRKLEKRNLLSLPHSD